MRIPTGRAQYYWLHGVNSSTERGVVLGPFPSEDEALEKASDLGNVKVYKLPTRNSGRATQMIKAKLVPKKGIADAMQRVRHGNRRQARRTKSETSDFDDNDPFDSADEEDI